MIILLVFSIMTPVMVEVSEGNEVSKLDEEQKADSVDSEMTQRSTNSELNEEMAEIEQREDATGDLVNQGGVRQELEGGSENNEENTNTITHDESGEVENDGNMNERDDKEEGDFKAERIDKEDAEDEKPKDNKRTTTTESTENEILSPTDEVDSLDSTDESVLKTVEVVEEDITIDQGEVLEVNFENAENTDGDTFEGEGDVIFEVGVLEGIEDDKIISVTFDENGEADDVEVLGEGKTEIEAQTETIHVNTDEEDDVDSFEVTVDQVLDSFDIEDETISQDEPLEITIENAEDLAEEPFTGDDVTIEVNTDTLAAHDGDETVTVDFNEDGNVVEDTVLLTDEETNDLPDQETGLTGTVYEDVSDDQTTADFTLTVNQVLDSFDIQDETLSQDEALEIDIENAEDLAKEPFTGDGVEIEVNTELLNGYKNGPDTVTIDFDETGAAGPVELLSNAETDNLEDQTVTLTGTVDDEEIVSDDKTTDDFTVTVDPVLASVEVVEENYEIDQGEPLTVDLINAEDIAGDIFDEIGDVEFRVSALTGIAEDETVTVTFDENGEATDVEVLGEGVTEIEAQTETIKVNTDEKDDVDSFELTVEQIGDSVANEDVTAVPNEIHQGESFDIEIVGVEDKTGDFLDGQFNLTVEDIDGQDFSENDVTFDEGDATISVDGTETEPISADTYSDVTVTIDDAEGDFELTVDQVAETIGDVIPDDPVDQNEALEADFIGVEDYAGDGLTGDHDVEFTIDDTGYSTTLSFTDGNAENEEILSAEETADISADIYEDVIFEIGDAEFDADVTIEQTLADFVVEDVITSQGEVLKVQIIDTEDIVGDDFEGEEEITIDVSTIERDGDQEFDDWTDTLDFDENGESGTLTLLTETETEEAVSGTYTLIAEWTEDADISDDFDVKIEQMLDDFKVEDETIDQGDALEVQVIEAVDIVGDDFEGEEEITIDVSTIERDGDQEFHDWTDDVDFAYGESGTLTLLTEGETEEAVSGTYVLTAEWTEDDTVSDTFDLNVEQTLEGYTLTVNDIDAGESLELEFFNAVDIVGGDLDGDYEVTWEIQETAYGSTTDTVTFSAGEATHDTNEVIGDAGTYTAETTIDGITETYTFDVNSAEADSYTLTVEDITAGEPPVLEFTEAEDEHENPLEGEYEVEMTIDDTTYTEDLTFDEGEADYTWDEIEEAVEYTASSKIDEVSSTDEFEVTSAEADSYELTVEDITAGEEAEIDIVNAVGKYGNYLDGDYDADIAIKNGGETYYVSDETLTFTEGTADYETTGLTTEADTYTATVVIDGITKTALFNIVPSDADYFEFDEIEDQTAGESFEITITAYDEYNNVAKEYEGTAELIDTTETIDPVEAIFSEGKWLGSVTITGTGGDIIITATDQNEETMEGTSNEFMIEPAKVDTVEIYPDGEETDGEENIIAGEEINFNAIAYDNYENVITETDFEFGWANTDDFGIFDKTTAGKYQVQASYEGIESETVNVMVEPAEANVVLINPSDNQTLTAGEEIDFSAAAYDEYGNLITDDDLDFTWKNTTHVGLFDETTADEYHINATHDESDISSEDVTVTVEPAETDYVVIYPGEEEVDDIEAGEYIDFNANAYDEYDNPIVEEPIEFNWENTTETGLFEKTEVGDYEVRAWYDGVDSTTVRVTVEHAEVYEVVIEPLEDRTITAGEEVNFSAEAYDEYGNLITDEDEDFTWENTTDLGLFDNETAGEYIVNATRDDYSVSSENVIVTVEPADVERVDIYPSGEIDITAGEYIDFNATAYDEYDNVIVDENQSFNWMNTNGVGIFTETTVGDYEVRAEYDGVASDTVVVTVKHAEVYEVVIEPSEDQTITAGEWINFSAEAYDEYDNLITDDYEEFDWENTDKYGNFTKSEAGEYEIRAIYDDKEGSITVAVEPADVDRVEIYPSGEEEITAGEYIDFNATAYDEYDNLIVDENQSFNWMNTDEVGNFTKTTAREYKVRTEYDGVASDTVTVTIKPAETYEVSITPSKDQTINAGDEINFSAEAYDHYGNLITEDDTNFIWYNPDDYGNFTETTAGEYEVTAAYEGVEDNVIVTVVPADVDRVNIYPFGEKEITAGEYIDFNATAYDEYDNLIADENRSFTWMNTDGFGNFTKTTAGNYEVDAEFDGIVSDTVTVAVGHAEVYEVEIDPSDDQTITAGEEINISAEAYDKYGNLITDEDENFAWNNATETGLFDETESGKYDVAAKYDGIRSDSGTFTVEPAGVDEVVISPDEDEEINAGQVIDFHATALDKYGNIITKLDYHFVWSNTDGRGLFDQTDKGVYEVSAIYDGEVSDPVEVTVEPAEVHEVAVDPSGDQVITAGDWINFSAEAYDKYGNLITDDDVNFDWENATETGLFDETESGKYDIAAKYDGIRSDSVTFTVEPAGVDEVVISPDEDEEINAGEVIKFEASALDKHGNKITEVDTHFYWMNTTGSGTFDETEAGKYEVSAEYEEFTSSIITVTVEAAETDQVVIAPREDKELEAGETIDFEAAAYDQFGNLITEKDEQFTWENATESGFFDETKAGKYELMAEFEGVVSMEVTVNVRAARVNQVVIVPEIDQKIEAGEAINFEAEAYDQFENLITNDDTEFYWNYPDESGMFFETESGRYEVIAEYEGVSSDTITVNVEPSEVNKIAINPQEHVGIEAGNEESFTAEAFDEYNNLITDDSTEFRWENTTEEGIFNMTTKGHYKITASYETITSEPTMIEVHSSEASNFEIHVDDIIAGETPEFLIENATDHYGNHLEGKYDMQICINDRTDSAHLDFDEGKTRFVGEVIEKSDFYEAELTIDGVNNTKTFQAGPATPHRIEIIQFPEEIEIGGKSEVLIRSYDEYGNPATDRELEEITLSSDKDGLIYEEDSIVMDEEGEFRLLIDWDEIESIGEHDFHIRGRKEGELEYARTNSRTTRGLRSWLLYLFGSIGTLSLYGNELIGFLLFTIVLVSLVLYYKKVKIKKIPETKGKKEEEMD